MLLPLAPGERDLHPHDDQVVEVLSSPSVPEYRYSFRMNESHTFPVSGYKKFRFETSNFFTVCCTGILDRCYCFSFNDSAVLIEKTSESPNLQIGHVDHKDVIA
jgi:hypothetical protein